ncbi:50S ribosomal protein L29 [Candidatus Falkowbacteria bacterium RIFOXYC2_FULL_47_12]|uniref:Large ribosomal subunit protein uL29 n=2 Tax=Candidatus Falkowiibacteriota TaxID=1752728 RepID=A0A1F5TN14_9BACT|nr:MAG: 50S ribosomal protein L29 [Candidatus Falkowbacteria bacterium RIFOXYA2_FULL_47_9]OGF40288.1 MAG: 50S ribosomal protein L29 [Candidatus Falkowbacteria bacterium RIFOXYC2_FULL_47_12]
MELKELQQKSTKDLHALLGQKREAMRAARFQTAAKQLKNVRELRVLKKDIAHILTVLNSISKTNQ